MSYRAEISGLIENISKAIIGKEDVIKNVLVTLLARGHLLIEDVPGMGKTTLALALAKSIQGSYNRIQFTSDLLPSDILGVQIFDQRNSQFSFREGPIFANIILADEINRTTPKTQSSLLEAMQDSKVTVEKQVHQLPKPFMVIATQNPIEFHGTYPLPESQLDRFLMKVKMGYPAREDERKIIRTKNFRDFEPRIEPVTTKEKIFEMQNALDSVKVEDSLVNYILAIVEATRKSKNLELGVSPRGTLSLYRAAQARAFVSDRNYCIPDDIKSLVVPVLSHRLIPNSRYEHGSKADTRGTEVILEEILDNIEIPL